MLLNIIIPMWQWVMENRFEIERICKNMEEAINEQAYPYSRRNCG